jgi:hypothetical protein
MLYYIKGKFGDWDLDMLCVHVLTYKGWILCEDFRVFFEDAFAVGSFFDCFFEDFDVILAFAFLFREFSVFFERARNCCLWFRAIIAVSLGGTFTY